MKKFILALTLTLPLALGAETFNYGFCPEDIVEEQTSALGSGKNNNLEVLLRLSPSEMPQIAALKGSKITGIRTNLRNNIERKGSIISRIGSLEAEITNKKDCWLKKGWNEYIFTTPIEIGDEDIYVGYTAFETQGSTGSHPVLAAAIPAPASTGFINIALSGWQDTAAKGSILLQAIIDGDATVLEAPAATATISDYPQLIAPSSEFAAKVSIKNLSSKPISSLTVDYGHGSANLNVNIAPFGVQQVNTTLVSPAEESTDSPFLTYVSAVNDTETQGYTSTAHLYITRDVFTRIPLIEEWTGLTCVNCPFMIYYMDRAREEYNRPHTYVAHHAGFDPDKLTQQVDKDLLFMFGDPRNQRNPAVMYDRSFLPGETEVIFGASEPSTAPYVEKLLAASLVPALAEVNVDVDGKNVTVHGKVSTGPKTADGKVCLSAYLIEDDINPLPDYPQRGVNADVAADAPKDMVETFRHNGVIRANLTAVSTGDKLEFDEEGYYSVEFTLPEYDAKWNADNMHVVAFIHRFDNTNNADNYVLNSGDSKPFVPHESGIGELTVSKSQSLRAVRALDGSIVVLTPVSKVEVYNAAGRAVNWRLPQPAGIYVVRATLPDGTVATTKVN